MTRGPLASQVRCGKVRAAFPKNMKRLLLILGFVFTATSWLSAQSLTAEDRARGVAHFKRTREAFLAEVKGLSAEQLAFKAAPERWSIAQVAEHIAASEDFLREMVEKQVFPAPARTEEVNLHELDEFVTTAIADRSHKVQAPEPLAPTNRFGNVKESVAHFKESRAKTLALMTDKADLREHATDSPLGKKLDAYQWLLFISAHCERHTKQIAEVKTAPEYPKN